MTTEQTAPAEREVNFKLLGELARKPHKLLNIAADFEKQIRDIPIAWTGEVFQETRTAHHLLDQWGTMVSQFEVLEIVRGES